MPLIPLKQFVTLSDKGLLDAHNGLTQAAADNFDYVLTQVTNPLPAIGSVGQVLSVAAGPVLAYASLPSLINVQAVMDAYLASNQTLRLESDLTLRLLDGSSNTQSLRVAATTSGGTVVDSVTFSQTSTTGDLAENHVVNSLTVTADSASVTMTGSAHFEVNRLKIGTGGTAYTLPAASGMAPGYVLVNNGATSAWQPMPEPVLGDQDQYYLANTRPFAFPASTSSALSVVLSGYGSIYSSSFDTGFGFVTPGNLGSAARRLVMQVDGAEVWRAVKPANVGGNSVAPHLQMNVGLALASASLIDPNSNPVGSIWYDSTADGIVLISSSGQRFIGSQAIVSTVNTAEVNKDFVIQPSSTLSVAAGSAVKPALNIGTAGLISGGSDVQVVLGGVASARISATSIEPAAGGASASAKISIDASVGVNDPGTPAYTFPSASGLGVFRQATHAVGVTVKGSAVAVFSDAGVSMEGLNVSNLANPTLSQDAATKSYVDNLVPDATVVGAIAVAVAGTGYVEEPNLRYQGGSLAVGSVSSPGRINLLTSGGGLAQVKSPVTAVNSVFPLPENSLDGGVLQLSGTTSSWVSFSALSSGLLRADGTVELSGGLSAAIDTTSTSPLLSRGPLGMYMANASSEIGFSLSGSPLLRLNMAGPTLVGATGGFNTPLMYLNNSIATYAGTSTSGTPTYSFAGEPTTGLGQTRGSYCSLFVNGTTRFSATSTGATAHGNKISEVGAPTASTDAATKGYVDGLVNAIVEISFRVVSLPTGWTSTDPLTLSIFDTQLVYLSNTGTLVHESASSPGAMVVPVNFATNPKCQVYVSGVLLAKQANASSVRQADYGTATSVTLRYNVAVGNIIVVQLPA
jgi:hypothetical protein